MIDRKTTVLRAPGWWRVGTAEMLGRGLPLERVNTQMGSSSGDWRLVVSCLSKSDGGSSHFLV
jgi:hypothetical protein